MRRPDTVARTSSSWQPACMQDFELYQQILGLTGPWRVKSVALKREQKRVDVEVVCTETVWGCPECGQRMHTQDRERRGWRHLDSCQFETFIVADVPRVMCPEHGSQVVAVPWAEKWARFTKLFERLAIDVMLECSIQGACEILGISWDEAAGIKDRAVRRGLERRKERPIQRVGVDAYSGRCRTVIPNLFGQGSDSKRTEFRFNSDRVPG